MLCIRYAPLEVPWPCCVPKSGKTRGFVYFHTQIRVFIRRARSCHHDVLARSQSGKDVIMTNCISLDTTLRELMNMVPDTTNIEAPTPRALRDQVGLLIKVDFSDGAMEIYENGFFIYSAKQRSAVVRVHDCASGYYYEYADGKKEDFPEDFWMDAPFSTRLAIEGERHLDMNFDRRIRKHMSSYDAFDFDPAALMHSDHNIDGYANKTELYNAIHALTPNQQEIINLVFIQGYSQADVARMKGCSKPSVTESLERARKRLKKILAEQN